MAFDPKPYLKKLGTNKDGTPRMYLETAYRVLWFRTENPLGTIRTELIQIDPTPVFRAEILNADGVLLATGYGSAQQKAGAVYSGREIEKAETAAIGRALGNAGYGTQFDGDDDSDHLADSPTERKPKAMPKADKKADSKPPAFNKETATAFTNHWYKVEMLAYEDILEALGVDNILKYQGTLEEAHAVVQKWCDDNPPVEGKTA